MRSGARECYARRTMPHGWQRATSYDVGRRAKVKNLGLKDVPIARSEDEALGLKSYAAVLQEFIVRCDTPITVALQGDWGSGKTSLMNLIKESLDQEGRYKTVWFNTWQYAQFNSSDTLALSMMSYFIDSLGASSGTASRAAKTVLNIARAIAVGGASVIGQGDTVKTVITEAKEGTADADPSRALTELKAHITTVVKETVEAPSVDKVIVFIDDIDRLVPVKAIELLEALKIFLDIDRCVYVIACDYSVVVTGLKEKFGVDESKLQGKSFFDKIIQVPFKMPIQRYKVEDYLESLLKKIDIKAEDDDIDVYQDLIESSIGFNPRTMKRMFNSLVLLMILARKELRTTGDDESRARVLFGVLCMQEHYEHLYDFIRRQESLSDRLFNALANEFDDAIEFENLREKMSVGKALDPARIRSFMRAFFRCLQLDEDEKTLSSSELKHLREVLTLSSIVSANIDEFKLDADAFVLGLRRELNKKYHDHLDKKRPLIKKFRYSRSEDEVFLELPAKLDWCRFTVQIEEGHWGFGLEAENAHGSLSRVERYFRSKLASVNEVVLDRDDYLAWYWRPVGSSSEDDLKESLHLVLDEMLPQLYDLCRSAKF